MQARTEVNRYKTKTMEGYGRRSATSFQRETSDTWLGVASNNNRMINCKSEFPIVRYLFDVGLEILVYIDW